MSFAVGICGGSGAVYGIRLVEALAETGAVVHVVASAAARRVLRHECGIEVEAGSLRRLWPIALSAQITEHAPEAVEAAPSSGSAGIRAVVLCPCSMGTLARVAHGFSSNLIERMADVALKEGRTLVVVPRETPLSALHLRNMLELAQAGAVVLPAMPGFYHRPRTVEDLVDFVVGKVLDRLGVESTRIRRWRTPESGSSPWNEGEEA
jgi:4-hydroxy-3-polyprenylbenzoate decarboxylase